MLNVRCWERMIKPLSEPLPCDNFRVTLAISMHFQGLIAGANVPGHLSPPITPVT